MAAFDYRATCLAYEQLLWQFNRLNELAAAEKWDELHHEAPSLMSAMQSLPAVDGTCSADEAKVLADYILRTQTAMLKLDPLLRAWQEEASKILQSLSNENKLFNAYGS